MARRSKLVVIAFAVLILAILWWMAPTVTPVVSRRAVAASEQGGQPDVTSPSVEALQSAPDRAPATGAAANEPAEPPNAKTTPTTEPSGPIQLLGAVTDSRGNVIAARDGGVGLTDAGGEFRSAQIEDGRYVIEGLKPGQYVLTCGLRGFESMERSVILRSDEVVHREDFALSSAWMITVHILTPEGEDLGTLLQKEPIAPLLQLSVLSTVEAPGEHLTPSFLLDRSGEGVSQSKTLWSADEERDDRIQVRVEPPIYVSVVVRDQVLATQRVQDRAEELNFTIGLDRLRALLGGFVVRLLDAETGAPATDAWVNLATGQSTERAVHPDDQGIVRYTDRVPGLYEVHAYLKDRAAATRTVELQPGQVTDLGTITFKKGLVIQGRCVDAEGHPEKVDACLDPVPDGASTSAGRPSYLYALKVDDQGLFSVTSLPEGRYLVRIPCSLTRNLSEGETGWTTAPILIDTRNGAVENLVIVVRRPVAATLHPISSETDSMWYDIVTMDGLSYCDGGFRGSAPERLDLAPGTYTLRLSRAHNLIREIPFTVGSSPVTIDVGP